MAFDCNPDFCCPLFTRTQKYQSVQVGSGKNQEREVTSNFHRFVLLNELLLHEIMISLFDASQSIILHIYLKICFIGSGLTGTLFLSLDPSPAHRNNGDLSDEGKAFYENLPFHGLQSAQSKVRESEWCAFYLCANSTSD
jgi:hypothetical protein